jgi:hypothetical protein
MGTPPTPPTEEQYVNDVRHHLGYFTPNGYMAAGNTDSGHHVMFGEIAGLGEVAVKPYNKLAKALNEQRSLDKVRAMPDLEALEPLMVAEGALASYLVTRYRDDLDHLGMIDWAATITRRRNLQEVIEPTLVQAATTAALWHNQDISHGDLQPKNHAYTPQRTPVFIDAARTAFHADPQHHTVAANGDIQSFGLSVLDRGLLADRSPSYRAGFLSAQYLEPYLAAVTGDKFSQTSEERQRIITDYWVHVAMLGGSRRQLRQLMDSPVPGISSRMVRQAAAFPQKPK